METASRLDAFSGYPFRTWLPGGALGVQPAHQRSVHPGPLVLGADLLNPLAPAEDRDLAVDVDSWARSACYPRSTFYPLSDGHSTLGRRITRTWFPTCSACGPRSQARLYSCALRTVADRPERTLRAPPLHFGRRPPQSNYPPDTVRPPAHGRALGRRRDEGGIPRAAPPGLASRFQSLPPILYAPRQRPMSS